MGESKIVSSSMCLWHWSRNRYLVDECLFFHNFNTVLFVAFSFFCTCWHFQSVVEHNLEEVQCHVVFLLDSYVRGICVVGILAQWWFVVLIGCAHYVCDTVLLHALQHHGRCDWLVCSAQWQVFSV